MNNRIREIRTFKKMTQEQFAEKLGLKRNTIATYETGAKPVSDRTISDICRVFDINEAWLREGVEPMFKEKDGQFSEYLSEIEESDDKFIKDLITVYMELDDISKEALRKIAKGLAQKYEKQD